MSVDSVFDEFLMNIRNNYSLSMFEVDSSDTGEGNEEPVSVPKEIIESGCTQLENARTAINNAFLCLFNDLEIPNGEHQNFLTINNIAEIFRNTPSYLYETKEFTDRLEYSYTRGLLYLSYSKGSDGTFLQKLYSYIPNNITGICNEFQDRFEKFIPVMTVTISDDTNSPSKIEAFWNANKDEFSKKINEQFSQLSQLAESFSWFYNKIIEFKDLGINAAKIQASGYNFVSAKDYSQQVLPTMNDVFSSCRTKFKNYDEVIDSIYELWLTVNNHVNTEYSSLNEYEIKNTLTKIYSAKILEQINFYEDAKTMYNDFLTFFSQYGIS